MMDNIIKNAHNYSFFHLTSLLEKKYQQDNSAIYNGIGTNKYTIDEYIRFSVSPELSYPKSDINNIVSYQHGGRDYINLEVNFLGLHGSSSPLPSSYVEKLAGRDDDNPIRYFLDFFHNRYLSLLYQTWKKYRHHVQYKSGAGDTLSGHLFNFIGLSESIQHCNDVNLDKAKLLSYVGQLSTRTRSPKLVSGIIAHCFGLDNVTIEEWVYRRVNISDSQINHLNQRNCILGHDLHIGKTLADLSGKFNLCINELDFSNYLKFLPGQELNTVLKELMKFILIDPLAWDIKIKVKNKTLPKNVLGRGEGNTLGQTFWLGTSHDNDNIISIAGCY
ncbi:type VI secretion system baseplate subunit TssG [Moritella viscosa]|uniref:Type VI secretion protein, family n=1 Tax=Moritella viscosa TaxID=80854 RepID=A0A090IEB6_9GAMM|nr:type VI secretion system baseplate subunit TssG [Moritella viscosa]CED60745.1 putative type VI secretion protein [Moritella viscosa]SGY96648.1 Type VI secretion protein, family [Moritella viscosa]SGZ02378.1 Type VI secretion protein, family [Moritella viscosa]SGZ02951.1 Type VI secretion protein, family [Moritella viscosa]SGZ09394.1 Type VI secretion protein, family [Moritella viscosa]